MQDFLEFQQQIVVIIIWMQFIVIPKIRRLCFLYDDIINTIRHGNLNINGWQTRRCDGCS